MSIVEGIRDRLSAAVILSVAAVMLALASGSALAQTSAARAGVSTTPRIIGGQAAAPGAFPSVMPMLQTVPGRAPFQRQGCAATLIAPNWVITAAHCVVDNGVTLPSDFWSVLPGVTALSTDEDADRSGEIPVVTIYPHPEFDEANFYNDVALMELAETIDLPVVSLFSGASTSLVGADAFVVGWGAADVSDPDNPRFPTDQQFVAVPIVSNEICNAPTSYAGDIIDSQICAGLIEGGIDSCQGDSGGPMIIGIDGVQVQAGIVSFGNGCALPNFYGVYTSISSFRAWISNFVNVTFLPTDSLVNDPGQQPTVEIPVGAPGPDGQPIVQADPAGPNPFGAVSGGGSGGGGAALWWLGLGTAVVCMRRCRQRARIAR